MAINECQARRLDELIREAHDRTEQSQDAQALLNRGREFELAWEKVSSFPFEKPATSESISSLAADLCALGRQFETRDWDFWLDYLHECAANLVCIGPYASPPELPILLLLLACNRDEEPVKKKLMGLKDTNVFRHLGEQLGQAKSTINSMEQLRWLPPSTRFQTKEAFYQSQHGHLSRTSIKARLSSGRWAEKNKRYGCVDDDAEHRRILHHIRAHRHSSR